MKSYFTVEQADKSLVLVARITADIVAGFETLLELQETLELVERTGARYRYAETRERIRETFGGLQAWRDEIEQMGAELRDWGKGIVHFPSLAGRREVQLCWKHGESGVLYWHENGECLGGRRPIQTLVGLGTYVTELPEVLRSHAKRIS